MKKIFVDTSAWLALFFMKDGLHTTAKNKYKTLLKNKNPLVTSNLIFSETLNLLMKRTGWKESKRFGEVIRSSLYIDYLHVNAEIETIAWNIFIKYPDQKFSFTDCTSFALMTHFSIQNAFSFDNDFSIAGFTLI